MKVWLALLFIVSTKALAADSCADAPPTYTPVQTTYDASCRAGEAAISIVGKSPVARIVLPSPQAVTISTHSGATSSGHNGRHADVCIWISNAKKPCAQSPHKDSYNDWDGDATCTTTLPAGEVFVRAWQHNESAEEINTSLQIWCK